MWNGVDPPPGYGKFHIFFFETFPKQSVEYTYTHISFRQAEPKILGLLVYGQNPNPVSL